MKGSLDVSARDSADLMKRFEEATARGRMFTNEEEDRMASVRLREQR